MGALVPPWYKEKATTEVDIIIAAFFFGASMTMAAFDFCKAVRQTYKCWRRNHRTNAYVVMVWLVLTTCIVTSITIWLFLRGKIPPRCVRPTTPCVAPKGPADRNLMSQYLLFRRHAYVLPRPMLALLWRWLTWSHERAVLLWVTQARRHFSAVFELHR